MVGGVGGDFSQTPGTGVRLNSWRAYDTYIIEHHALPTL